MVHAVTVAGRFEWTARWGMTGLHADLSTLNIRAGLVTCAWAHASTVQESLCSLRFAAKVNATDIGTARRMALPASSRG